MKLLIFAYLQIVAVAASSLDKAKGFVDKLNLSDATAYGSYAELYADKNVGMSSFVLFETL